MKQLRLKIYEVIEPYQHSRLSKVYDYSMLGVIILSLISLTTRLESPLLSIIDKVTDDTASFMADMFQPSSVDLIKYKYGSKK